jgi:hypothetical protein
MPQKFAVFVLYKKRIVDILGFRRSVVEAFALLGCYFLSLKM